MFYALNFKPMMGSQLDQSVCYILYTCNSAKKYFDIIKNDDLSSLYQEIYSKIIAQEGFQSQILIIVIYIGSLVLIK